jgi:glutathione S-transferase
VIPPNTAALQASWVHTLHTLVVGPFRLLILPGEVSKLDDPGAVYLRQTREKTFGVKLEELAPPGEKRDAAIEQLKHGLSSLNGMLNANGDYEERSRDWVMGSVGPTFADFALAGFLMWFKLMGDPEAWRIITAWNGGRWSRHLDQLESWTDTP